MNINLIIIKVSVTLLLIISFYTSINSQVLLNNPESVIFDATRKRYIVSNWGNGALVQIDSNNIQSYFSTEYLNQYKIAGLYLYGDTLLCAAGDALGAGIAGFNIETADLLFHLPISGIGLPNDITSDIDGNIYVTDYWDDKLYKITNYVSTIFIGKGILNNPNGMIYDQLNHRLLILSVAGSGAPVLAVSLFDSSVSTIVTTGFNGTDGITQDSDDNFYISEWTTDRIYKYDRNFSDPPEVFADGNDDPADIYCDRINALIVIPNFSSNTVNFVPVNPVSVGNKNLETPVQKFLLDQNYPNPFNSSTIIPFQIFNSSFSSIKVFDLIGREISVLVFKEILAGNYTVSFDASSLPSGYYFYRLQTMDYGETRKMVLIK